MKNTMKKTNTFEQATLPWYGWITEKDGSITIHYQISLATPVIVNYYGYDDEVWTLRYIQNIEQKRSSIYEAFEDDYYIGESMQGIIKKKDLLDFIVDYLRVNDFKHTRLNRDFEQWFMEGSE